MLNALNFRKKEKKNRNLHEHEPQCNREQQESEEEVDRRSRHIREGKATRSRKTAEFSIEVSKFREQEHEHGSVARLHRRECDKNHGEKGRTLEKGKKVAMNVLEEEKEEGFGG